MPIKKRTRYIRERVHIRKYLDGPKKPPHQKIVVIPVRKRGDTYECLVADVLSHGNTVGGVWFPVVEISSGLKGGNLYRLDFYNETDKE